MRTRAPNPWVKPAGPVAVDWRNPLARDLAFAALYQGPGLLADLTLGLPVTLNGADSWVSSARGAAINQTGSSGDYLDLGNPAVIRFSDTDPWTIFVVATVAGGGGSYREIIQNDPGGFATRPLIQLRLTDGNVLQLLYGSSAGLNNISGSTSVGVDSGLFRSFAAARTASGGAFAIYLDGKQEASGSDNAGTFLVDQSTWQTRHPFDGSAYYNGAFLLHYFWRRALSDSEIVQLHRNPFAFLAAVAPAAAISVASVTVAASTASVTASQPTASASGSALASPSAGSVVASEPAPSVRTDAILAATTPSAAASQPAASVSAGTTVSVGTASAVASQPTPAFSGGVTVSPAAQALAASDIPVSVSGSALTTPAAQSGAVQPQPVSASGAALVSPSASTGVLGVPIPSILTNSRLAMAVQPATFAALPVAINLVGPLMFVGAAKPHGLRVFAPAPAVWQ